MKQMAGNIPGMPGMRRSTKKSRKGGKPGKKSGGNPGRQLASPAATPQLPPGMKLPPGLAADLSNLKLPPH
jgi:hypothetical protein